jgi:hypothetical protein
MADTKPTTILDIETLNAIAARLSERADSIHQFSLVELVADLKTAAGACRRLAEIRYQLTEIAANAMTHPNWDRAAFARDLRALIEPDDDQEGE